MANLHLLQQFQSIRVTPFRRFAQVLMSLSRKADQLRMHHFYRACSPNLPYDPRNTLLKCCGIKKIANGMKTSTFNQQIDCAQAWREPFDTPMARCLLIPNGQPSSLPLEGSRTNLPDFHPPPAKQTTLEERNCIIGRTMRGSGLMPLRDSKQNNLF